jgi:glycerol-3-phosphate dehydrogenase
VIIVTGGKLTTYRSMAEDVVDAIFTALGRKPVVCYTASEDLPGQDRNERRAAIEAAEPELARSVLHGLPYTCSDVVLAATDELAVTLADVMIRRTHIAFELFDHGVGAARTIARLMAPILGWDQALMEARIEEYSKEANRVFGVSGHR